MASAGNAKPESPWHAAYPAPRNQSPESIDHANVLEMIKGGQVAGKDYVLVDLRRNDHEGGTIRGSINLPAQSLFPMLSTLYTLFKSAGVRKVIWYCGRGTRGAAWFADQIEDRKDTHMHSLVLTGGIKGWATAGPEYVEHMDEHESKIWDPYRGTQ